MRYIAQIGLALILLFSYSVPVSAATDSTGIRIQIIVKEPTQLKKCNIGFDVNNHHLFNSANSCQFDRAHLLEQATLLAQANRQKSKMNIVSVTVTAQ